MYGAYAVVFSLSIYGMAVGTLMLPNAVVRFYPEEGTSGDALAAVTLGMGLVGALLVGGLLSAFAPGMSRVLLKSDLYAPLMALSGPLVVVGALQRSLMELFRARGEMRRFALVESVLPALEVLTLAGGLLLGHEFYHVVLVYVVVAGVGLMGLAIGTVRSLHWEWPSREVLRSRVVAYVRYALPLVPTSVSHTVTAVGDRFVVGFFLGAGPVGLYSVVYAVASSVNMVASPVVTSLMPKVAGLWSRGEVERARQIVRRAFAGFAGLSAVFVGAMAVLGVPAIRLLLSEEDRLAVSGEELWGVSVVVALGVVALALMRLYSVLLFRHADTRYVMYIYGAAGVFNVALNVILVPTLGLMGAALCTLVTYVLALVVTMVTVQRLDRQVL